MTPEKTTEEIKIKEIKTDNNTETEEIKITNNNDTETKSNAALASQMRELHKLYHTEFAGRLKRMQEELDAYYEIDKGRVFDGILAELANIYSQNEGLADELGNKKLGYMFMDLLQIMENNGVRIQKSQHGERRNPKHCQIIDQIPTDNPNLHDTIAKSMNTGFYVENRNLVKERVCIYILRN